MLGAVRESQVKRFPALRNIMVELGRQSYIPGQRTGIAPGSVVV